MRIAVVHPYPVSSVAVGGVTRVYELVRYLAGRGHSVTVLTHAPAKGAAPDQTLTALGVEQQAFRLPRASPAQKLAWWFDAEPYFVHRNVNPELTRALAVLDRAAPFDAVHLELAYMAPCLSGVGRHAVRVLAEQEVMSQVMARLRRLPWRDRTVYERLAPLMAAKVHRFERQALCSFDLLYGITPADRDALQAACGRPAAVFPHIVAADRFAPPARHEEVAGAVVFVGNFDHRPNLHGAKWFVDAVWPALRALHPLARFTVVGPAMPKEVRRRFEARGVEVAGYAPDIAAVYRSAAVVVAPLLSGGGMRGKVLEAFAAGCAVVGTSMSFEGIACTSSVHCTVADDPAAFAAAIARYATTPTLRAAHGAAARQLVVERYDGAAVFGRYEVDLERAVAERQSPSHRRTIA